MLLRIVGQVVERTRGDAALANQTIFARRDQGVVVGLREGEAAVDDPAERHLTRQQRAKIPAPQPRRTRQPERRQRRRQQIDGLHDRSEARALAHPRPGDDERHTHLLLVDGGAVVAAAVLAELLAVVRGDDHDRRGTGSPHRPHDAPDAVVGRRNLAVVASTSAEAPPVKACSGWAS